MTIWQIDDNLTIWQIEEMTLSEVRRESVGEEKEALKVAQFLIVTLYLSITTITIQIKVAQFLILTVY